MPSYIGPLDSLQAVSWTTSESMTPAQRYTFQDAPARRWSFTSSRPDRGALREWSVEFSGTNRDKTILEGLATGAYGNGPFVYISEGATLTNVLTPAQSRMATFKNSGSMTTVGGYSPVSLTGGASVVLADEVPVAPGKPATFTVDAMGPTTLTVQVKNASGGVLSTVTGKSNGGGLLERVSATIASVPWLGRYLTVSAAGYNVLSQPQVTWTEEPVPFEAGGGAAAVVISEFTADWRIFETATGESWRNMSVKIVEVG